MKSSFELVKREKNEVTFKMAIAAENFEDAINKAYDKNKNKYVVDGFRKGKAPKKIIEMKYGEGVFYDDAINIVFPSEYTEAVNELDLEPVDRPTIDVDEIGKEKNLSITVMVTVKPEVEVKNYKGIEAKKVEYNVTDEDVEKELKSIQERNARLINVDREAKEGDSVGIDYKGFIGEEQFEGGTAENQILVLGTGSYIPGFEEQLVGHKAGEEIDVQISFPEDYHENLAGKEAVFKVKINEVQEKEMPELDDEFAKDVSEFDTLEEFKKDTYEKQLKTAKDKAENEQKKVVLEKLIELTEVDIPQVMIEDQIDDMIKEFDFQLKYQGLDIENYLQYINKDMSGLREDMKEDALKKVKTRLAVETVASLEDIQASDEDMEQEIKKFADEYKTDVESFKSSLKPENYDYIHKELKYSKTIDFLVNNANLS